MSDVRMLQRALQGGEREVAHALARRLLDTPRSRSEALLGARLAGEAGAWEVALELLERTLATHPDDEDVREELGALLEDMGDEERATDVRRHSGTIAPTEAASLQVPRARIGDAYPSEETSWLSGPPETRALDVTLADVSDADLMRFYQRFQGRENTHARQWRTPDGKTGYAPIRQALTPALLRAHLQGTHTLGIYPIRLDHTVTFLALDLDITRRALDHAFGHRDRTRALRTAVHEEGLKLSSRLNALGVPHLLFDSGYKGRHAWIFLSTPQPAELGFKVVSALARHLAPSSSDLVLEAFPRQAGVRNDGLGNLIKVPFGIHLRTGRRAHLLDAEGLPDARPWQALAALPTFPREALLDLLDTLHPLPDEARPMHTPGERKKPASTPDPNPAPPPFREADFDRAPEVAALLAGCPVLRSLKEKALEERRLRHDERVVIRHTLGHVERGVEAVRYLFGRCPEIPHDAAPGARLRGSPMSCARVRQRIPETTSRLPCHCTFPKHPDHYPSPVLHAPEARTPGEAVAPDLAHRLARWLGAQDRGERFLLELHDERRELVEALRALPEQTLRVPGGCWRLRDPEGLCELTWTPDIGPEEAE